MKVPSAPPDSSASGAASAAAIPPRKLLDQVRDAICVLHYSLRTERAYVDWSRRYTLFHGKRHPRDMGAAEVEGFLTHLATVRGVASATQRQARSALLFLYKKVLKLELPWLDEVVSARPSRRLPVVLAEREVAALLQHMPSGPLALVASLLYGTGMRLLEVPRPRVKNVEFKHRELIVRQGKATRTA